MRAGCPNNGSRTHAETLFLAISGATLQHLRQCVASSTWPSLPACLSVQHSRNTRIVSANYLVVQAHKETVNQTHLTCSNKSRNFRFARRPPNYRKLILSSIPVEFKTCSCLTCEPGNKRAKMREDLVALTLLTLHSL